MSKVFHIDAIQTYNGKEVNPFDFKPENVDIDDIAHALSNQCRFSGHTRHFYSVAQHSVLASIVAEVDGDMSLAKTMLMHDAAEAYLLDIPRPIKRRLASVTDAFMNAEEGIMRVLSERFLFKWPMDDAGKEIDNRMLFTEKRDLMEPCNWGWEMLPYATRIIAQDPREAKYEFLGQFGRLFGFCLSTANPDPKKAHVPVSSNNWSEATTKCKHCGKTLD